MRRPPTHLSISSYTFLRLLHRYGQILEKKNARLPEYRNGDLKESYTVLDAVFAVDSHTETLFRSSNPAKAFGGVKRQLRDACEELGGDAVIACQFE